MDIRHRLRALRSLARHSRDPGFLAGLLNAGLGIDNTPKARPAYMLTEYPELVDTAVSMGDVGYGISNQDPLERWFLGAWCRTHQPRRVFEIGTFDGATTLILARNAPNAEVFTLDLPPKQASVVAYYPPEQQFVAAGQVGRAFRDQPEASRITQLWGDSRTFDFDPWAGSCDLVVVDGGHERDCVEPDTANALRMVKPGGVVVWDDYSWAWPDVIETVDALGKETVRIQQTDLALLLT
jgi:predicted O-methyltransferase YrrM